MSGKTMFLIRVQEGKEGEFVEHWKKEIDTLRQHRGFRKRELIRVVTTEGLYVVLSEWDSPQDYLAWRDSADRARIYGSDLSPLFSAPPMTGVGEVLLEME